MARDCRLAVAAHQAPQPPEGPRARCSPRMTWQAEGVTVRRAGSPWSVFSSES